MSAINPSRRYSVEQICSPASQAPVTRQLRKVSGLEFNDAYQGRLSIDSHCAEVRLEPNDAIRVRLAVGLPDTPLAALGATGRLAGNIRFARDGDGHCLLADTSVDGEAHLAQSIRQIRWGFRSALGESRQRVPTKASRVDKGQVQAALDQLPWDPDSLVRHEEAWELRPCVYGEPIAVRAELSPSGTELVLCRKILSPLPVPPSPRATACADQALRFNCRLRFARLAHSPGGLVCESRLHDGQLTPHWLALAARAVAFASGYVQLTLRVLAEQEAVAQTYVKLFCPSEEPAAPQGVAGCR